MDTEEGPTDPTDPVGEPSPANSPSADSTRKPVGVIGTIFHSGEPASIGTSSPVVTPRDSEPGPDVGNQEGDPQDVEAESDGADEKYSLGNEELGPRGMEATPALASSPPETVPDARESSAEIGQTVPTTERCITPTDLLSVDSPSRPRISPKRKQLSPPEGREVAEDWENAVKRHSGSTPEHTPFSRLPGRMPYWSPPLAEEMGLGATGEEGGESMPPREKEEPVAAPTMPDDRNGLSEYPGGEELKEPLPIVPSDGEELSGPPRDGPSPIAEALDLPGEKRPTGLSEGEGLGMTQGGDKPVGTPG